MKFITDVNLGKLAKWMRILGYNTVYHTGNTGRDFLKKAAAEGRIALTRKKDMARRQFSGRLVRRYKATSLGGNAGYQNVFAHLAQ